MGTCNFHKSFAANYYVVDGRRYIDSDGEEYDDWQEGCDVIDDTEYELEAIVENAKEDGWIESEKKWHGDDYDLCHKWYKKTLSLGHVDFDIRMEISVCPGYYEACNLDWDLWIAGPGYYDFHLSDFYDVEGLAEEMYEAFSEYEDEWNEGMIKMQKKNIIKKALDFIREVGLEADDFCRKNCTGKRAD